MFQTFFPKVRYDFHLAPAQQRKPTNVPNRTGLALKLIIAGRAATVYLNQP
jgi:hypothetical protein